MAKLYDEQLRAAIEEIRPILKKYDCMATVLLASPTHSEFLLEPTASWSVCRWEGSPSDGALRFRSKREDFLSKEAQDRATEATVHGIESLRWLCARFHDQFSDVVSMLRKHMVIGTEVSKFFKDPDSTPKETP